ncbi:ATP-binding protein [Devosia sp. BK]|jgi:anti-sigma regulatory factor (Ser/Thr protein kinase)|uniref:ATP-binding protein n=1 Tax=unclassified Devosia TaxID=196773 RepID=UPI00071412C3|nr:MULTISPECIES: ATP-binding protein [unclassified Devosia]KQT50261.1 hypothetical protein ASG47_19935 [Devosia sp. Leaf420]MDV3252008.1 ATP-binding protein [Devosia sp. BK]
MLIELAVKMSELDRLAEAVERFCEDNDVPPKAAMQLNLVLEELFTNTVSHGYHGRGYDGLPIRVALKREGSSVLVDVSDGGSAFDPLGASEPDLELDVEDRPIGGLGIHFLRTMMTDLRYSREGERNRLSFSKALDS